MMATMAVRFVPNRTGLNQVLRGRNGPVVLHLANLGRQVAGRARRLAPRSEISRGPHLADNISSEIVRGANGFTAHVIADVPHALYVTKGTKPHDIGSPVLVAPGTWRYIGRSPAGRGKPHPGTKPNDFLSRAAAQLGLKVRRVR
jgi:hypothetical protein